MYVQWPYLTLVTQKSIKIPLSNEQDSKENMDIVQLCQNIYV